jgi:hypothetical protein
VKNIVLGIWENAPVWIWPLFFVLLAIGMLSRRDRSSSIIPYFFYPLFGLSALTSIGSLVHAPLNWVIFGAAYLIGVVIAFRWQDGLILSKVGWKMQLKGDKITMVILMTIFFSNFVNGVLNAVAPAARTSLIFTVLFAGIVGLCSGSFTGRAARVVTLKAC